MANEIQWISAYNLFRRKSEPDLCCAVRQDKPIPPFLETAVWEFGGTIFDNGTASVPTGFKPAAAHEASAADGFYVFFTTERSAAA